MMPQKVEPIALETARKEQFEKLSSRQRKQLVKLTSFETKLTVKLENRSRINQLTKATNQRI